MFSWIKQKVRKSATNAMRDDLERFVRTLEGLDSEELAWLLVAADEVRERLKSEDAVPDSALSVHTYSGSVKEDAATVYIQMLIKNLQSNSSNELATGAMVWLHSLRAIQEPELRSLGRRMWGELARGREAALAKLDDPTIGYDAFMRHYVKQNLEFVPGGLEPDRT